VSPPQLATKVCAVTVAAFPLPNPESTVNHWCLFLELDNVSTVIKVDMTPGDTLTGLILFHAEPRLPKGTAFPTGYPVIGSLSAQRMFDMLSISDKLDRRLDRYKFTEDGNGCAYWASQLLLRLEEEKHLEPGTAKDVWDAMKMFYVDGQPRHEVRLKGEREGLFY
jgi:hypothetical protein